MNLIDRYVYQVGRYLPRKQRVDIQAELRSLLQDSIEARTSGEVTEEDEIAVLKEFGPPAKVAASYAPESQYLIGPAIYPMFRLVLSIVLVAVSGALLLAIGLGAVFNPEPFEPFKLLADFVGALISSFGWVVLVFIVLQRFNIQPELNKDEDWDPRELPEVVEADKINPVEQALGIAFGLVFAVVLLLFANRLGFFVTPGGDWLPNPVLVVYLPLIIASLLLSIGLDIILLVRGHWELPTRIAKVAVNIFGIGVLVVLFTAHSNWLAERGAAGFFASITALGEGITPEVVQVVGMQAFRLAFGVALIVTIVDTVVLIYRLVRRLLLPEPGAAFTISQKA